MSDSSVPDGLSGLKSDEILRQRSQREARLIEQAERLNGGALMREYLAGHESPEAWADFNPLQFERWLLGVLRRSTPAHVGTYDPAEVTITIGAPVDAEGNAIPGYPAGTSSLASDVAGFNVVVPEVVLAEDYSVVMLECEPDTSPPEQLADPFAQVKLRESGLAAHETPPALNQVQ